MQRKKKAALPSSFPSLSSFLLLPPAPRPPGVPPTRKGFATRWRGGTDTHNKGRSRATPGRRPRYYTGAAAKARTGAPTRRAAASHGGRGGVGSQLSPPTYGASTRGLGGGGSSGRVRALHFRFPASLRPGCMPQVEQGLWLCVWIIHNVICPAGGKERWKIHLLCSSNKDILGQGNRMVETGWIFGSPLPTHT